ncbi:MAG: aminotransferase class V-fold PLP-dependent enzyme [Phycisphaerales bacterium]|nr:aminotransferase class V-fold PLP-dependent enzyme [Phycisphaerales bacterium]
MHAESRPGGLSFPEPSPLAHHWLMQPGLVFLNHGSFGAMPRPVLEFQRRLQEEVLADPVGFIVEELEGRLDEARAVLAQFVGCDANDLAFVHNATSAVNTVVRSLSFSPGDELLTGNHEYNACNNALWMVAERVGAGVVIAEVPYPIREPEEVVRAILSKVTGRTKLALVSHVTSPTAAVFPIERIVAELAARGVDTLVDGAHTPGMVEVDIDRLGAAYYTGNLHKWPSAPLGSAFLHVRRDRQKDIRPLVISHGANAARPDRPLFRREFDYVASLDYTGWLSVPRALEFMGSLHPGGWPELRRRNRELALAMRRVLVESFGGTPPVPEEMIGSMATAWIPAHGPGEPRESKYHDSLQDRLVHEYRVQAPIIPWVPTGEAACGQRMARVSAQAYNTLGQAEYLAGAIKAALSDVGD